jgi:AraC-like DNA-binding protein
MGNGWRQLLHFIPQAYLIVLLVWYTLTSSVTQVMSSYADCQPCRIGPKLLVFQLLAFAYLPLVLVRLYQFRRKVALQYSSTSGRDLHWLLMVTIALLILLCLWLPLRIQGGYGPQLLAISRLVIIMLLGWYGLRQQTLFLPESDPPSLAAPQTQQELQVDTFQGHDVEIESADVSAATVNLDAPGEKYARSGMTAAAQSMIATRLEKRMSQFKDYLEPDLRLNQLAARIGTSPQLLSQYLNEVVGQSFFDYINSRRVVQVQELMHDPAHADTSLLDLALAAGFNSKTTFNTFFKKSTGMTPSAWRKQA